MYAKAGRIHEARGVFDRLPERDVISCTAIIAGYAQLDLDEEALELFSQSQKEGMESNYVTYASVLTAFSGLAALGHGQQVHNRVLHSELPSYVVLKNSVVDMYSKCGSLTYSRRVLMGCLRELSSYGMQCLWGMVAWVRKRGCRTFQIDEERNEVKPDSITFMAVISGCSHGGLVDEVLSIFGKMMPFIPSAAIWGSLLGACRVHADGTVGEYFAQCLFDIEPQNAGNYVVLSNLYASVGRWEDVTMLRQLMMEKSVTKEPGRSCIKQGPTIKEAGYVPDLSCVLYDVDDEQKERILLGHSEKLVLAFGMIGTPPGFPIRIMKNLCISVDCHNFAKYLVGHIQQ
ncbi:hypothetical protein NE237_000306 [Protea cynaroides]|uniref:DYW domain-containing protein n=1 Tax=Protea cynaroides TaxID=273540 RepID=A0A9Q0KR90_9MAGN|nr:hypothetical protein NE237_000306 [Protea cynaroides]